MKMECEACGAKFEDAGMFILRNVGGLFSSRQQPLCWPCAFPNAAKAETPEAPTPAKPPGIAPSPERLSRLMAVNVAILDQDEISLEIFKNVRDWTLEQAAEKIPSEAETLLAMRGR